MLLLRSGTITNHPAATGASTPYQRRSGCSPATKSREDPHTCSEAHPQTEDTGTRRNRVLHSRRDPSAQAGPTQSQLRSVLHFLWQTVAAILPLTEHTGLLHTLLMLFGYLFFG